MSEGYEDGNIIYGIKHAHGFSVGDTVRFNSVLLNKDAKWVGDIGVIECIVFSKANGRHLFSIDGGKSAWYEDLVKVVE